MPMLCQKSKSENFRCLSFCFVILNQLRMPAAGGASLPYGTKLSRFHAFFGPGGSASLLTENPAPAHVNAVQITKTQITSAHLCLFEFLKVCVF